MRFAEPVRMEPLQHDGRLHAALREESWDDLLLEHPMELAWHPRGEEEAGLADVEREAAGRADRVVDHFCGGGQHGLLPVVGWHHAAAPAEELFHPRWPLVIENELDAGGLRRDFLGQVVDRGAQAAVDDDRVGAAPRQPKRPQQALPIVTDRRFPPDREPDVLELLTDVAEVGVDDLPRQDLVTRADDLDAHHWDRIIHSRVPLRPMTATEAQSPLDAAQKLAPQIRSCADEIEAARKLPRPLFEALADAGLFHLALPRALGGPELDLPTYIRVIEELGKADASTAWTVNQGAIFATYAARMPRDVARSIWIDTQRPALTAPAKVPYPGPLYRTPRPRLSPSGEATVALGLARSCLEAFSELAGAKTPRAMPGLPRDQPMVQADIGHAEAHLRAGRALLTETVREVWADVSATNAISLDQRAALRLATTHAIRLAVQVVDTAYNAAGATAVFESHLLQCHFQDIHVISQHLQGRLSHYELVGRHWLGLPVDETRL